MRERDSKFLVRSAVAPAAVVAVKEEEEEEDVLSLTPKSASLTEVSTSELLGLASGRSLDRERCGLCLDLLLSLLLSPLWSEKLLECLKAEPLALRERYVRLLSSLDCLQADAVSRLISSKRISLRASSMATLERKRRQKSEKKVISQRYHTDV